MSIMLQREPDGSLEERFVNLLYQPLLTAEGTVTGIFSHGVDITEQVQARREAEESNRVKDEFLATLSHELRTPLTSMLGWSRMLRSGQLGEEEFSQGLESIERNAEAQAQLIEDILDVSRVITGNLRLDVQTVELAAVIEEAINSVLPAAEAKGIHLQRVLDSGALTVAGDRARLQQVVWNLLSNAMKFTPAGGRVQVRLERVQAQVQIVVSDNGEGISPDKLAHIFERFRQVDATSTRKHGGLGLGLAIVRHLVELHGGEVEADSKGVGHGATFTVKLPHMAARSVTEARRSEVKHSEVSAPFACPPALTGRHVLVVDDRPDTRVLVTMVLEKCGARVTTAASAPEAFAALTKARPDVLISDIAMPEEDGYSLIQRIRALPAVRGGTTPALALSAYARPEDRQKALNSGFQEHLAKPVEPLDLVTVVTALATHPEQ